MAHFHSDNFKTFLRASTAAAALVWGGYTAGFAATLDITGIDAASDLYETVSGGSLLREETAEDADPLGCWLCFTTKGISQLSSRLPSTV